MPMIDVYATDGTFEQGGQLAADLARTLMVIEGVPDIPMFRLNTAAFIHQMPPGGISNVEGQDNYVRVQVLTNAGALDRDKQLAVVDQYAGVTGIECQRLFKIGLRAGPIPGMNVAQMRAYTVTISEIRR